MPIYVDADACPVKDEVYKVARRYETRVFVVANSPIRVPKDELIEFVGVKGGFDVADNWIAERATRGDVVITTDIPLADRCLRQGARVLGPKGTGVHRGRDRRCPGDPRTPRHAAAVGRLRRRSRAVLQGRPIAVPLEAGRGDERGAAEQTDVK